MKFFRNRYQIRKNNLIWFDAMYRKWWWPKWKLVGYSRKIEGAMNIINEHKNPIVYEE